MSAARAAAWESAPAASRREAEEGAVVVRGTEGVRGAPFACVAANKRPQGGLEAVAHPSCATVQHGRAVRFVLS